MEFKGVLKHNSLDRFYSNKSRKLLHLINQNKGVWLLEKYGITKKYLTENLRSLGFDNESIKKIVMEIFDHFMSNTNCGFYIEGLTFEGHENLAEFLWKEGLLKDIYDNWYHDGNYYLNSLSEVKQKRFFINNSITFQNIELAVSQIQFIENDNKSLLMKLTENILFGSQDTVPVFKINLSKFHIQERYWIIEMFKQFNFVIDYPNDQTITLKIP